MADENMNLDGEEYLDGDDEEEAGEEEVDGPLVNREPLPPVRVEIDMDALWLAVYGDDRVSLQDRIVEMAAVEMVNRAIGQRPKRTAASPGNPYEEEGFGWLWALRDEVARIRTETIRERFERELDEVMSKEVVRTDSHGTPISGTPITLAEIVESEIQSWLTDLVGDRVGGPRVTRLQKMIREEVGRKLTAEFKGAFDEGKVEVKRVLREKGAEVLADLIEKQAAGCARTV